MSKNYISQIKVTETNNRNEQIEHRKVLNSKPKIEESKIRIEIEISKTENRKMETWKTEARTIENQSRKSNDRKSATKSKSKSARSKNLRNSKFSACLNESLGPDASNQQSAIRSPPLEYATPPEITLNLENKKWRQ